jgi:amidohydrolase
MNTQDARDVIAQRFQLVERQLADLNRWMYDHPETAYEEFEASARLADFLDEAGFAVERPAYGLETAFAARIGGGPGPHVVLCAEYDALPVVGHACGHNLIACISVGAAHTLAPLVGDFGFRLTVLGTPGEESRGGKAELISAGAFQGVDFAMMVHPAPHDVLDPGFLAMAHLDVEYHGVASHAAMAPERGVNALDAFVQAYVGVSALRQQVTSDSRVHGVVIDGGESPNVIPARTRSEWYVRATDAESLGALSTRVEACFQAAGQATGCTHDIRRCAPDYHELVTDQALAAAFERAAARVGRRMRRTRPGEVFGSTDMGNVSRVVPSIHPLLALGDGVPNHDPRFSDLTVSADGLAAMRDGIHALAETVIDVVGGAR